jgi:plasmid stabilization system protein ParE
VVRGEERVKELARMLGDRDMASARRHAVELLRTASATGASESETPSPPESASPPPRRSR